MNKDEALKVINAKESKLKRDNKVYSIATGIQYFVSEIPALVLAGLGINGLYTQDERTILYFALAALSGLTVASLSNGSKYEYFIGNNFDKLDVLKKYRSDLVRNPDMFDSISEEKFNGKLAQDVRLSRKK